MSYKPCGCGYKEFCEECYDKTFATEDPPYREKSWKSMAMSYSRQLHSVVNTIENIISLDISGEYKIVLIEYVINEWRTKVIEDDKG